MTIVPDIKEAVRARYGAIALGAEAGCCGSSCGGAPLAPDGLDMIRDGYDGIEGRVAEADLHLGCGVPTRHAGIQAGDTVLDLGSGAGNDVFIARRLVGDAGHVIGVDMTEAMIARARANAAKLGYGNVEFRLGEIEAMPVESGSIDVVISNCVLNLVPDKAAAFAEIARVLRPGGHFCISDIVSTAPLPEPIRAAAELYVGCISGAIERHAYLDLLRRVGLTEVAIVEEKAVELPEDLLSRHLPPGEVAAFAVDGPRLLSVTVVGRRPS